MAKKKGCLNEENISASNDRIETGSGVSGEERKKKEEEEAKAASHKEWMGGRREEEVPREMEWRWE